MSRVLHIEVNWANGRPTRHLVLEEELDPPSWEAWVSNLLAAARPKFTALGRDLVFHTQTVQSIELVGEVDENQEGS